MGFKNGVNGKNGKKLSLVNNLQIKKKNIIKQFKIGFHKQDIEQKNGNLGKLNYCLKLDFQYQKWKILQIINDTSYY